MSASNPGPTNCRVDPPNGDGVAVPLVNNRRRLAPTTLTQRHAEELGPSTSLETPQRRENPVTPVSSPVGPVVQRVDRHHTTAPESQPNAVPSSTQELPSVDREAWLKLHAAELIRRLQTWANGLDAREASLNAACARQDLRERQFRLKQAEFQAEMNDAQQAADEIRRQIVAQSRRLAFQSLE